MNSKTEEVLRKDIRKSYNNKLIQKFINAGLEEIRACINCGTCTGSCPSGKRTALRVRSAIKKALDGDESILKDKDIWFCSTCYYCYERCPRNIPVTDMIIKLRNIAVEEGYILDNHFDLAYNVFYKTCHAISAIGENNKKWRELRESYDLPSLPPTVHSYPEAVKECQKLMREVKFKQLLDKIKKKKKKDNKNIK
ncbi:MAG: CoB--CoM heterodisulfide reductase subunit C [Candidatus Lokiarchaeota archaeon]|nr:CoB--CoM heterodisulfide reductase subunit C [Candidatus Lokiarchaeota archaeon]